MFRKNNFWGGRYGWWHCGFIVFGFMHVSVHIVIYNVFQKHCKLMHQPHYMVCHDVITWHFVVHIFLKMKHPRQLQSTFFMLWFLLLLPSDHLACFTLNVCCVCWEWCRPSNPFDDDGQWAPQFRTRPHLQGSLSSCAVVGGCIGINYWQC